MHTCDDEPCNPMNRRDGLPGEPAVSALPALPALPGRTTWASLGVIPSDVRSCELLAARHRHHIYRVTLASGSRVVKVFDDPGDIEPHNYRLLQSLGIPTIPTHGLFLRALVLEDLCYSSTWRLAVAADGGAVEVGEALASWYKTLHQAGRAAVERSARPPAAAGGRRCELSHLGWEADVLAPETVAETAAVLGLQDNRGFLLAAENIGSLLKAMRSLPATLTYNDFALENVALSRSRGPGPQRAVVFDYHLLGIGLAASDVRNVASGLEGRGRETFLAAYGPVDPTEELFDRPVGLLVSLHHAARRPRLPSWAGPLVKQARSGALESSLADLLGTVGRGLSSV